MHRNTFICSPKCLNADFSFRENKNLFFAGQLTGVEGYMESAASGLIAGINAANTVLGKNKIVLPKETMIGALAGYISDETVSNFNQWVLISEFCRSLLTDRVIKRKEAQHMQSAH